MIKSNLIVQTGGQRIIHLFCFDLFPQDDDDDEADNTKKYTSDKVVSCYW